MSDHLTLENIDRVELAPLDRPAGWQVSFASANPGLNHQLYVNGSLADFTDCPGQRVFEISATACPQELAIAAVPGRYRSVDLSAELPGEVQNPPWILRRKFLRDVRHRPGERLAVYHDSASGEVSSQATFVQEIWPVALGHWGFGLCQFGLGGFGVDGSRSPGLGGGAFGLGPFGLGTDLLQTTLALSNEGTHAVEYRVVTADGETSTALSDSIDAAPPPQPATSISATNYDQQQSQLTLQLS